jgi:hypothetical protein
VQPRLKRLDAREVGLRKLDGRELLVAHQRGRLSNREVMKISRHLD